ncbi:MAG: CotH kinase family protein, partial [Verrucomicrobiota bacterium]
MTRRPCSRPARPAVLLAALLLPAAGLRAQVAISEFLASNSRGLVDSDGVTSDWIELRNTGDAAVNLLGWSLTDDPAQPRKWVFPETNLPPNTSWVIFASGKDRAVPGGPLHTSFSLSADGEYLALFPPEGEAAASEFAPAYPRQRADISYGFRDGQPYFFNPPSPGQPNSGGVADFVGDTRFSRDRGFYDAPFDLVLTCATPGAAIRYTTNGAPPTLTTGLPYTAPVRIDRSVVIRAAAFRDGLQPSNVDTHTYLFPADVIRQSPNGERPWAEWPAPATSGRVYNYGMDPDIVNSPRWRDEVIPALRALPTLSVVTALPNLFSSSGIYQNPSGDGRAWERPCSIELIWPDGTAGFQVDCGIRIRGGFSRSADNPKHAFRFLFREQYGASKLRYPLHPGGTDAFDNLDFRTFQNYSWSFQGDSRGVFIRDQFSRDAQLAMGHNAERGRYVHLYLNGIYWGIYNSCERAEASYGETYFGGQKTDYDVVKIEAGPYALEATDGNLQAWTRLYNTCRAGITNNEVYFRLQGRNADGSPNPQLENLLEVDNLIDYLLVIFFGGNLDAPISNFLGNTRPNNWYGMRNRTGQSGGFRFFSHDAEHTLLNAGEDRTGPYAAGSTSVTYSNPQYLFQQLAANPEFRLRIGDRAYRHFFNGGPLSTDGARALFGRRTNELYSAVVAESARWGDSKVATPFNRDDHWRAEAGRIMGSY